MLKKDIEEDSRMKKDLLSSVGKWPYFTKLIYTLHTSPINILANSSKKLTKILSNFFWKYIKTHHSQNYPQRQKSIWKYP